MFWVMFVVALLGMAALGAKVMDSLWQRQIVDLRNRRKGEAQELRAQLRRDPEAPGKNHLSMRITTCDHQVHLLDDLLLARRRRFR